MLLGPGRWGTTTPSLGVPVRFIDIGTASVLCEIAAMRGDFVPDVSLGTHFLNELIEADMLYLALYPARDKNFLNRELLLSCPNRLVSLVPEAAQWADALRVVDGADLGEKSMMVYANSRKRRVVCCLVRR
jgi:hypothetical protein